MSKKTPTPLRLPERTLNQLAELTKGGYCTNRTSAVVAAVDLMYRWSVIGENIDQPVVLVIGSDGVTNLPVSPESRAAINEIIGSVA